jgi:type II secretory pathway pseudopilin PulG
MRILSILILALTCAASVPAARDAFRRADGETADARAVLREVERAQNEYRAAHGRYAGSIRALGLRAPADVMVRVAAQGAGGWSAVATAAEEECAVFHGSAPAPRSYARTAGRIACRAR